MTSTTPTKPSAGRPNRRGVIITGLVLTGMIAAILLVGIGSGLADLQRRNEGIVPRIVAIYALYPDDTLRYTVIVHPADPQLIEEDTPPEQVTDELAGPPVFELADVSSAQPLGRDAALGEPSLAPHETIADAAYPLYPVTRMTGDGFYGLDLRLAGSPLLSEGAFFLNAVQNTRYAQTMIAVALPRLAVIEQFGGFEPYRMARVGDWQVHYYDFSLIEEPQLLSISFDMSGAPTPADFDPVQVDQSR